MEGSPKTEQIYLAQRKTKKGTAPVCFPGGGGATPGDELQRGELTYALGREDLSTCSSRMNGTVYYAATRDKNKSTLTKKKSKV